jgi:high-affinity iron transporter
MVVEPTVFLVTLRESLEAFLILSILTGLVVKLGHRDARRPILWGAALALAASILIGVVVYHTVYDLYSRAQIGEYVEGAASVLAVGILTYMVIWMYRHTLGLVDDLRKRTHAALDAGRPGVLFALAFVAVLREGIETVLIVAGQAPTTSALDVSAAVLLGIAASGILAWLLFAGIIRLNLQRFFAASGILLIFFAAGLLSTAIHEFAEVGLLPTGPTAWDTEALLDQQSGIGSTVKAVFGYREKPSVLEAAAYAVYLLGLGAWYVRGLIRAGRARSTPHEAAAQVESS